MKKIFFTLCLLYSVNACAMSAGRVAAAIVLGTTPVTIPALCLFPVRKSTEPIGFHGYPGAFDAEQDEKFEKEYAEDCKRYESFKDDAWLGVVPGMNIRALNSVMQLRRDGLNVDGFFSGLSLYITVPLVYKALSMLKKVK